MMLHDIWRFTLKYSSGEEEREDMKQDLQNVDNVEMKLVLGFTEAHYTILFLYIFYIFII